jgi:hypothetical protein
MTKDPPLESQTRIIDLEASSRDEHEKRLVASADADKLDVDKLGDSVRINRAPRAQTPDREMLQQPLLPE